MSVLAQLEPRVALSNRRYAPRRHLRLGSVLLESGAEVVIHDLSVTGLLIETAGELATGERLLVELPDRGPTPATVVWNDGNRFGCEFEESVPAATISAALLRDPVSPASGDVSSEPVTNDRLSPRTRMLVILGLALLAWVLVGSAIVLLL